MSFKPGIVCIVFLLGLFSSLQLADVINCYRHETLEETQACLAKIEQRIYSIIVKNKWY